MISLPDRLADPQTAQGNGNQLIWEADRVAQGML